MNGDELAAILRRRCKGKPIAFVTSEETGDSRLSEYVPGCRVVHKPVDVPHFLETLHEMAET